MPRMKTLTEDVLLASADCGCATLSADDTEQLDIAKPVRWEGPIGYEEQLTGDGRLIRSGALRWADDLAENPIKVRFVKEDVGAHDGAVVVGRVDQIERREGGMIWAAGDFDGGSPEGQEAIRQVGEKLTDGVSMDLDEVSFEVLVAQELLNDHDLEGVEIVDAEVSESATLGERSVVMEVGADDEVMVTKDANIRAITMVAVPAFSGARIALATERDPNEHDYDDDFAAIISHSFNWVEDTGGLPAYIRDIADALMRTGMTESHAIPTAVNTVKRWAAGGTVRANGGPKVGAETIAKAQAALAEWEANRAEAAVTAGETSTFDEFDPMDGDSWDALGMPSELSDEWVRLCKDPNTSAEQKADWINDHADELGPELSGKLMEYIGPDAEAEAPDVPDDIEDEMAKKTPDPDGTKRDDDDEGEYVEYWRDLSQDTRDKAAEEGNALPDGSFPILNCSDLDNAVQAIGRASDPEAAKALINKRNGELDCGKELPWAGDSITASVDLDRPPAAWFADPKFKRPTALTITKEGRIYGHLATWGTCHLTYIQKGQCITPPRSKTGYAHFATGSILTAEGSEIPVGQVTLNTKHAGEQLSAAAAQAHYDNTGTGAADVAVGEDAHGIWIAGAIRSTLSPAEVRVLRASPVSGDWRRSGTGLEMVGALCVNVQGYAVPRPKGLVASGHMQSLVAAGMLAPRKVRRPGLPGAFSAEDLRYLKRILERERRLEADELLSSVQTSALRIRANQLRTMVNGRR